MASHRRSGNSEYVELMNIPLDKVNDTLASFGNELSPSAVHILARLPGLVR
jgi:hypothetical protein